MVAYLQLIDFAFHGNAVLKALGDTHPDLFLFHPLDWSQPCHQNPAHRSIFNSVHYSDVVLCKQGIGNGLPLAAVVTTPEIAEVLARKIHFNTYGGNPVSSAAGRAVLKVIDEDNLQQNCAEVRPAESLTVLRASSLSYTHKISDYAEFSRKSIQIAPRSNNLTLSQWSEISGGCQAANKKSEQDLAISLNVNVAWFFELMYELCSLAKSRN